MDSVAKDSKTRQRLADAVRLASKEMPPEGHTHIHETSPSECAYCLAGVPIGPEKTP